VNLELLELIDPDISLVFSVSGGGKYNFPHRVAIEGVRGRPSGHDIRAAARTRLGPA
jgi:hypothetical protein